MTNLNAIRAMPAEELATFLEDVENYDNPDHEWRSEIQPVLPFDSWEDWLKREAIHGKEVCTDR